MSTEVHAILFQDGDRVFLGQPCKTRECAEQSVSPVEGATVLGVVSGTLDALPEPIMGMRYVLDRAKGVES